MTQHTPTPYSQGITLRTHNTRHYTEEEFKRSDREEKRRIFSNFTVRDEGKSRRLVAVCENEEDAAFIVRACNAHDDLVKVAESIVTFIETVGMDAFSDAAWIHAEAKSVLAKVKND